MNPAEWTMDRAANAFWQYHLSRKANRSSNLTHLKSIRQYFKGKFVQTLTYLDVEAFRSYRLLKVSKSTVNREHGMLVTMFNKLKEWQGTVIPHLRLPDENPGSRVKKFDEVIFTRRLVLSREKFEEFLGFCDEGLRDICLMAVLTGLRRRDLMNLNKSNINPLTLQLEGIQSKTGMPYAIPITPPLWVIIDKARGYHLLDFKNYRRRFNKARKDSGIYFWLRDLRRTMACHLLDSGADIMTVKEMLGHKNITMTQRYLPRMDYHLREASEKLSKIFIDQKNSS